MPSLAEVVEHHPLKSGGWEKGGGGGGPGHIGRFFSLSSADD